MDEQRARILHDVGRNQEIAPGEWKQVLGGMGIVGEPVGAEKLQQLMLAEGILPEDNLLSRGIIEMREE